MVTTIANTTRVVWRVSLRVGQTTLRASASDSGLGARMRRQQPGQEGGQHSLQFTVHGPEALASLVGVERPQHGRDQHLRVSGGAGSVRIQGGRFRDLGWRAYDRRKGRVAARYQNSQERDVEAAVSTKGAVVPMAASTVNMRLGYRVHASCQFG